MRRLFWLLGIVLFPFCLEAQTRAEKKVLKEARAIVDTLCGRYFGGRGYQGEGHKHAARYIANAFQELGLEAPEAYPNYLQSFPLRINQAQRALLEIGGERIEPGTEFIIHKLSGSGMGTYPILDVGYGLEVEFGKVSGKVVVFREGWPDSLRDDAEARKKWKQLKSPLDRVARILRHRPAGFIILKKKLTAGFTRQSLGIPAIEMLVEAYPEGAESLRWEVISGLIDLDSQNVLGMLPGDTDTTVIISAHYDHLGGWGDIYFPGANDNASGMASLLSLARYFAKEKSRKYNLLFIAFGAEETGLVGSRFYVEEAPAVSLAKTRFVLNLDLMGNGDEGIVAVAGYEFPVEFAQLKALNDEMQAVSTVKARRNRPNSDHYFFVEAGVPAFFVFTLGGPPHYHDVNDSAENLLFSRFIALRKLLIAFVEQL